MCERGHFLREALRDLIPASELKLEFAVDSRELLYMISTLHESKEYRLWPTVTRIRN